MERFGFGHPFIEKKEPRSFLIKLTKKRVESLDSGCDIKIYPKRSSLIENQNTICPLTNNPTYTSRKTVALNPVYFYIHKNDDLELRHWTYADRFNIRRGTGYQNMI